MQIRCDKCRGKKTVLGLGMMRLENCNKCDGLGTVEKDAEQDDVISTLDPIDEKNLARDWGLIIIKDLPENEVNNEALELSKSNKRRIKEMKKEIDVPEIVNPL